MNSTPQIDPQAKQTPGPLRSLRSWLGGRLYQWRAERAQRAALAAQLECSKEILRIDWPNSLTDPTGFYLRCYQYFHRSLPESLRQHRRYFAQNGRGFGEDAFHVLWRLLVGEFKPLWFLEIGVYRGQVISLVALLHRHFQLAGSIHGISPFTPAGDAVSHYRDGIDYLQDTLENVRHFSLPEPNLLRAYSTEPAAQALIARYAWDLIYIDGNHDYEVVREDWRHCAAHLKPGGVIVLDDAALSTSYQPPAFAKKGHPGPSRLAGEMDQRHFQEILQVGHNRAFQKVQP